MLKSDKAKEKNKVGKGDKKRAWCDLSEKMTFV